MTRYERRFACYQAVLKEVGFVVFVGYKVRFSGVKEINDKVGIDFKCGISLDDVV